MRMLISVSVLLTLFTVIVSAYIRLSESGVGCTPWPDCYARLNFEAEHRGIAVLTPEGEHAPLRALRLAHRYVAST